MRSQTSRPYRAEKQETTHFYKHAEEIPKQINPTGLKTEIEMSFNEQFPLALREKLWQNSESVPRYREKVAQALEIPFGLDAHAVVCAFPTFGHVIQFSYHRWEE